MTLEMDIKGIARNIFPFNVAKASEAKNTRAKTDANNDREGNGQSTNDEERRAPLTPEEIQEAIKFLEGLAGVKDNGLNVRAEAKDGTTVVYVEDREGKVVRRIAENDLRSLTANRQKKNGHLLNKAM